MWFDRLIQKKVKELPGLVEPGRFQWFGKSSECLNGHSPIQAGGLLVGDGSGRCQLRSGSYSFILPKKDKSTDIDLFNNAIITIGKQLEEKNKLISPILPAAVVDSESHLLPLEELLEETLDKGHLHQISRNPRLDIRYDEEVTDVARAKRLARGALVHLASHSECWQRQTLSGIVPKKVKARFSEDDFNIYENIVYARLLDKLDRHLNKRINTIESLNDTLEQALEIYTDSVTLHHKVQDKICKLWGQTFDEDATSATLALLVDTLNRLRDMHLCIRNLKQSSLYLLVARNDQVGGALHRTNILNHDPHYRHLAILWDELTKHQQKSVRSSSETFQYQKELSEYYSRFSGLVLQHAIQRYLDEPDKGEYNPAGLSFDWTDKKLTIVKDKYDWKLDLSGPDCQVETLLHLVPWLNFTEIREHGAVSDNALIAWPALHKTITDRPISSNHRVAISPMDLYCIERLGWFIDKSLNQILLKNYAASVVKIPTAPANWIKGSSVSSIQLIDSHPPELKVLKDLSDVNLNSLIDCLKSSNAKVQAKAVEMRVMEIRALRVCNVCESKLSRLDSQKGDGFRIDCTECGTQRYMRVDGDSREFEIKFSNESISNSFSATGRWYQYSNLG